MTQEKQMPTNIMLEKWADIGFNWQGVVAVNEFERLACQLDRQQHTALTIAVMLEKQQGILWLSYQVKGELSLACQRCLSPMTVDVSGEYRLAILRDDSQMGQIGDADFVLVDEICDGRQLLPLKMLLEDELLLALPLSARHADCQMPIEMNQDEKEADNPFAVLAQLKTAKPS